MAKVKSFDSMEEMLDFIDENRKAAVAHVRPTQEALTKGDFYAADSHMGFAIFGELVEEPDPEEEGLVLTRAFSQILPGGELGYAHIVTMIPITADEFQNAKESGWRNTDVVIRALRRMQKADAEAGQEN